MAEQSAIFISIIEMIAIIILVIITGLYVHYTKRIVKEMQKERRIAYLEKQLEKLYLPLERYRDYLSGEPLEIDSEYESNMNDYKQFITDIHKYSYLARPKLKDKLDDFLLNVEDDISEELRQGYVESILASLELDKILAELKELIK